MFLKQTTYINSSLAKTILIVFSFLLLCATQNIAIASPYYSDYPNALLFAENDTETQTVQKLQKSAEQGDADSQLLLGSMYYY